MSLLSIGYCEVKKIQFENLYLLTGNYSLFLFAVIIDHLFLYFLCFLFIMSLID